MFNIKRINQVLCAQVEVLKEVSQIIKQRAQRVGQSMQTSVEGRLLKYYNSLSFRHIAHNRSLIPFKEAGRLVCRS